MVTLTCNLRVICTVFIWTLQTYVNTYTCESSIVNLTTKTAFKVHSIMVWFWRWLVSALNYPIPIFISHTQTHTHTHPLTDTFPLFCISETTGPIELKFCMHIEYEEAIIIPNYTKLIGRRLGYANEGQSSNIPLFCISRTSILIELKFDVHIQCD